MSLSDALLLDPHRHPNDVWLAVRTDGVKGSGTESDPYNGSVRTTLDVTIDSITADGTTATVTTIGNHGFSSGEWVTISGLDRYATVNGTTYDNIRFCGTFQITRVSDTSFTYQMLSAPGHSPATGTAKKCWREREQFDAIMRAMPANTAIHLGPGVFPTKGYSPNIGRIEYYPGIYISGAWQPRAGQKILGSGIGVTTLQLAGADVKYAQYWAVGSDYDVLLDAFEIADLTIDCDIAGQPEQNLVAQAITAPGSHIRIRRVRAINFGTQLPIGAGNPNPFVAECFPIRTGGAHPNLPAQPVDCVIEDCIIEQPGLNNARETTCLSIEAGEVSAGENQGIMAFPGPCVIRNCFLNLEYQDHPVAIASISTPANETSTVTTRSLHDLAVGQWIRITGAVMAGAPMNGLDNAYNGSYQVLSNQVNGDYSKFTYKPEIIQNDPSEVPLTAAPSGDLSLGRFPSLPVGISAATAVDQVFTITTATPHFLVEGSTVQVFNLADGNGAWTVTDVPNRKQFSYTCLESQNQGSHTIPSPNNNAYIGADFHGISGADIVEGNRVFHCAVAGPYHDTYSCKRMVVRNNHYHNVLMGEYHQIGIPLDRNGIPAASVTHDGLLAFFTMPGKPHGFTVGQGVLVRNVNVSNNPQNAYNGAFLIESIPTLTSFTYRMSSVPQGDADTNTGDVRAAFQVEQLIIENNLIELAPSIPNNNAGLPIAIDLSAGFPETPVDMTFMRGFRQVIIRNNRIGNANKFFTGDTKPIGILLVGCEKAVVEHNVVTLERLEAIQHRSCTNIKYFNNTNSAGQLVPGYYAPLNETPIKQDELSTQIEDAMLLALIY